VAQRLGILGGTFDPPHNGHVAVAAEVRDALQLDRVLVVPANVPWQKIGTRPITDARDRVAMTRLAMAGVDGVEVSTMEIERGGSTYTADTLEALVAARPGDELFLVVGSDVAAALDTWKRPEVVAALSTLVIYDRAGTIGGAPPAGWSYVRIAVPLFDMSSTELRSRVHEGRPIDGLVPPAVVRYLREHGLYVERPRAATSSNLSRMTADATPATPQDTDRR
jgi:nicotinate-nucleotide adenylyltransferase